KETHTFIQDYKNHTVNSETYFTIAQMMINDSRPEMKQLGVLCAGSAPSLNSFEMLATVAKGSSANAATQQQAQSFLNSYGQTSQLPTLSSALQSGNTSSQIEAAQLIDTDAQ